MEDLELNATHPLWLPLMIQILPLKQHDLNFGEALLDFVSFSDS
jgi:hypothetical protein